MSIRAILETKGAEVISVPSDASVRDAVALLADRRIGAVPVVDDGRVVGIFSERDLVYAVARHGAATLDQPVSALMTADAVTAEPALPVMTALSMMTRRRIRHLPVLDGGAVVGFVSIGDLVKYRIDRIEADAASLRDYIQSA